MRASLLVALGLSLGLTACATTPQQVAPAIPTQSAYQVQQAVTQEVARDLYRMVNEERVKAGLKPLEIDPKLEEMATSHTLNMFKLKFFGHGEGESSFASRINASGLDFSWSGENVGETSVSGPGTPASEIAKSLMEGWLNSPGHKDNMLRHYVSHMGIGVAWDPDSGIYRATQIFVQKR